MPVIFFFLMNVITPCTRPALLTSQGSGLARFALAASRRNPLSGSSGSNGGSGTVADARRSTPSMSSRVIGPPLTARSARRAASNGPQPPSWKAHQAAISNRCGSRSIGTGGPPRRRGLSRRFMAPPQSRSRLRIHHGSRGLRGIRRRELAPLDVGHRLSRLREFVSGGKFVLDQGLEGAPQRCGVGGVRFIL